MGDSIRVTQLMFVFISNFILSFIFRCYIKSIKGTRLSKYSSFLGFLWLSIKAQQTPISLIYFKPI